MEDHIYPYQDREVLTYTRKRLNKLLPYGTIMNFALLGIATLFVGLSIALFLSHDIGWAAYSMPDSFLYSSILLGSSSLSLYLARHFFKRDTAIGLRWSLVATLMFSIGFLVFQFLAWRSLWMDGITLHSDTAGSYLYFITGLHAAHISAGIIFLLILSLDALKRIAHPALAIVYFTNPVKELYLKLLNNYWYFMAAIWAYLVIFFFMTRL